MIYQRASLLPLLLALTSGAAVYARPNVDHLNFLQARGYGDLTPEQEKKIGDIQIDPPACMKKCAESQITADTMPLCVATDQDTPEGEEEEAVKNAYSCMCTDKYFVAQTVACYVKECASNSTAFEITLTGQYGMCKLYGDINYPEPKEFLNDLCLLDDMPKGSTVPTDLPLLKLIWDDYSFADDFPKKTATTWAPSGTPLASLLPPGYKEPQWTCTPTPLADSEAQDDAATTTQKPDAVETGTSGNGTTKSNGTTTNDEGAATSGNRGVIGMAAVVAAVAGLAAFL